MEQRDFLLFRKGIIIGKNQKFSHKIEIAKFYQILLA